MSSVLLVVVCVYVTQILKEINLFPLDNILIDTYAI